MVAPFIASTNSTEKEMKSYEEYKLISIQKFTCISEILGEGLLRLKYCIHCITFSEFLKTHCYCKYCLKHQSKGNNCDKKPNAELQYTAYNKYVLTIWNQNPYYHSKQNNANSDDFKVNFWNDRPRLYVLMFGFLQEISLKLLTTQKKLSE